MATGNGTFDASDANASHVGNAREKHGKLLNHKKTEHGKTKRGYNKRQSKSRNKTYKFSLMGCNANGIKAKIDSLENAIDFFNRPSCLTIQETKLRCKSFNIPGYQTFLKNRNGLGGGLLTAIEANLSPVLVSSPENEILVVQVKVGH